MIGQSVIIDTEKCVGCTVCIKLCPSEAIRLRNGKAEIQADRCVDCGRCHLHCAHKAVKPVSDKFTKLLEYKYKVALPDPVLYGQFKNLNDPNIVLNALLDIGFDDAFDVARAAELISFYCEDFKDKRKNLAMPRISCGCPSILRIIARRFPDLIPNVASVVTPMQLAAKIARIEASQKTGLKPEEIGIFGIVPCAAQVNDAKSPINLHTSVLDGAFAIKDIYPMLLEPMKRLADKELPNLVHSGEKGVMWTYINGESHAQKEHSYLAVDGISNCIHILEEIDAGRIDEAEYVELAVCPQGCVGGFCNVENPYTAALRIRRMRKNLLPFDRANVDYHKYEDLIVDTKELDYVPVFLLDEDRSKAMEKMQLIESTAAMLPKLDCGSCGSPSCRALAEDIVQGKAVLENCIFRKKAHNDNI